MVIIVDDLFFMKMDNCQILNKDEYENRIQDFSNSVLITVGGYDFNNKVSVAVGIDIPEQLEVREVIHTNSLECSDYTINKTLNIMTGIECIRSHIEYALRNHELCSGYMYITDYEYNYLVELIIMQRTYDQYSH